MSNCRGNPENFALACGLRDRGIPVDEYELKHMEADCLGLEIEEDRSLPSTAFNLSSGGAGYLLSVAILNQSARPLTPLHIGFEGPAWEMSMSLLPDPHKEYPARRSNVRRQVRDNSGNLVAYDIARDNYVFRTRSPIRYEREAVLNHRIARNCFIYPGEFLEGWLLVVGERPIPPDYPDRSRIKMRLTLFDHRGRSYPAVFYPIVERSREEERRLVEVGSRSEK